MRMQVPLTAVLLLFELTHDYSIILPTLGAVGLSYWIASLPTLATALKQVLPSVAGDVLRPPGANATPWQTVSDPDTLSGQLGMGIATGNTQEQQRRVEALEKELMEARGQGRRALVMQRVCSPCQHELLTRDGLQHRGVRLCRRLVTGIMHACVLLLVRQQSEIADGQA